MNACIVMICLALGGLLPAQANAQALDELSDEDAAWTARYQSQADDQFELLTAAYELDEDIKAGLRQELEHSMVQQRGYDEASKVELAELAKNAQSADLSAGSPDHEALKAELLSIYERRPLNLDTTALWVEGQLPLERAAQGRVRLAELRHRCDQRRFMRDEDLERRAGSKRQRIRARQAGTASVVPSTGKPMPRDRKEAAEAERRMEQAAEEARTVRPSSQTTPHPAAPKVPPKIHASKPATVPKQVPLTPAPPLDEWDRQVIQVAEKYEFSESQITMARAILRGLRSRAYQYRMSRASEYAQAELMTDKKAREGRLEQLDTSIDALFEELKQRLECLPTSEQKEKAKSRGKAPK